MKKVKFWFVVICISVAAFIGYKFMYNSPLDDKLKKPPISNLASNISKVVQDNIDKNVILFSDSEQADAGKLVAEEKSEEKSEKKNEEENEDEHVFSSVSNNIPHETLKEILSINDDDILLGDSRAKVQMIEYSSLTCPACKYYHLQVFEKIKKKYIDSGKVVYVMREFPFDSQAYHAAVLARCSGKEKFYTFIDVLFKNQEAWAYRKNYKELLTNIAQLGGLDSESFAKCIKDSEINRVILNNNIDANKKLRLGWAPVLFINGEQLDSEVGHNYELLSKKIDEYLDKSKD